MGKKQLTIGEAHALCVDKDRDFQVRGYLMRGFWASDRVMDFVRRHRDDKAEIIEEDNTLVKVEWKREAAQ